MSRALSRAAFALLAAILGAVAINPPTVQAHGEATGIVKERMDLMKSFGTELKALVNMLKGEATYDPAAIRAAALKIESHAGRRITDLFPAGSTGKPSDATGAIWSHWADFESKADAMGEKAAALVIAADSGIDGVKPAFAALAETCKACHQDYKEE